MTNFEEELKKKIEEKTEQRLAEADMMEQDLRNVRESFRQLIRQAQAAIDYITERLPKEHNNF
jgi:hypothetical protein